jgi:hypothetical protein
MHTNKKTGTKDIDLDQQKGFIEGDNVVPQGGHINENEEPVEEKSDKINKQSKDNNKQSKDNNKQEPEVNPPLNPPQKTEKKIPILRNES